MLLKTYRAADLATALARARAELGPGALVLATRESVGRLGLPTVEVTVGAARPAAADDGEPRGTKDVVIRGLIREMQSLRRRLDASPAGEPTTALRKGADAQSSHAVETEAPSPRRPRRPAADRVDAARVANVVAAEDGRAIAGRDRAGGPPREANPAIREPTLRAAVRALVASGLSENLAHRFAVIAGRDLRAPLRAPDVARATESGIGSLLSFAEAPLAGRCLFVVGPPGAGKTTTVAKLATRLAGAGRAVHVAEADPDPAGSLRRLEAPCRFLGAGLQTVSHAADLLNILETATARGAVLVDTPGIGSTRDRGFECVRRLRRAAPDAGMVLLLPAGLPRAEAASVLHAFAELRPSCVAFSRLDDGGPVGELVTAVEPTRLPLAFTTHGRRAVDLEQASPRRLAATLLRAGLPPARPEGTPR